MLGKGNGIWGIRKWKRNQQCCAGVNVDQLLRSQTHYFKVQVLHFLSLLLVALTWKGQRIRLRSTHVCRQIEGIWRGMVIPDWAASVASLGLSFFLCTYRKDWGKMEIFLYSIKIQFFLSILQPPCPEESNRKFQMREPFNLISDRFPALTLPLIWSPVRSWLFLHVVLLLDNLRFPHALWIT